MSPVCTQPSTIGFGGLFRIIVIAGDNYCVCAHQDFAVIGNLDFHIREKRDLPSRPVIAPGTVAVTMPVSVWPKASCTDTLQVRLKP